VNGRLDVSGPPDIAWQLARSWPEGEFVLVEGAGHGAGVGVAETLVAATDRFAANG
jgi:proline iminopeptidase